MEAAAAPGVGDVELVCKTLQVEHKLFYFDLKENPRGRYLKISEKTSGSRSTIIVPIAGVVWFVDLFNYYANGDEPELSSKELQLDTKVIFSLSALSIMRLPWKYQGMGLRWLGHMGCLQFSQFNSHEFHTSNCELDVTGSLILPKGWRVLNWDFSFLRFKVCLCPGILAGSFGQRMPLFCEETQIHACQLVGRVPFFFMLHYYSDCSLYSLSCYLQTVVVEISLLSHMYTFQWL
jgi:hypothetical protein